MIKELMSEAKALATDLTLASHNEPRRFVWGRRGIWGLDSGFTHGHDVLFFFLCVCFFSF